MVAIATLLLLQVPPASEIDAVAVDPTQRLIVFVLPAYSFRTSSELRERFHIP
jgi:hypothetical protein